MSHTITDLKPLTTGQYEECRGKAITRVEKRIGDKPARQQFQRELSALWSVLDIIALVVFIPALVVSSIHIIAHMGKLAESSFILSAQGEAGTVISRDLFVAVHQWMLIPLAEGSMILFLVMFGMTRGGWRRWVYFALAVLAGVFVLVANFQSGIGLLESLLAPAFTIGIGLKLEHIILQSLKRKHEVDNRYLEAMGIYEAATQDATQHPDYLPILRQEIWQKLVSLKANQEYIEAPTGFKHLAVKRELERERWAYEGGETVDSFVPLGEGGGNSIDNPFGSTVPDLGRGGPGSMPMIERVNGHGGKSTVATN